MLLAIWVVKLQEEMIQEEKLIQGSLCDLEQLIDKSDRGDA
jgi:hypothetical protein